MCRKLITCCFKPAPPYKSQKLPEIKCVNHVEKHITGLQISRGCLEQHDLNNILLNRLNVAFIYIRRHQKFDFLTKILKSSQCKQQS